LKYGILDPRVVEGAETHGPVKKRNAYRVLEAEARGMACLNLASIAVGQSGAADGHSRWDGAFFIQ
jgi:hypothetical protein